MIKTSLIALMTVVAASGVAAPAFAATTSRVEDSDSGNAYFSDTDVIARLQQRGVEATSVEGWGTLIRAYVRNSDGTEAQLFFDRDTLAPVNL